MTEKEELKHQIDAAVSSQIKDFQQKLYEILLGEEPALSQHYMQVITNLFRNRCEFAVIEFIKSEIAQVERDEYRLHG
jgi:hypothetical protein